MFHVDAALLAVGGGDWGFYAFVAVIVLVLLLICWYIFGAIVALVLGVPLLALRMMGRLPGRVEDAYNGLSPYPEPTSGCVYICYHTYSVDFITRDVLHELYLSPSEARRLLWLLFLFNCNLFCHGNVRVPIRSFFEYRSQLHSVNEQEAAPDFVALADGDSERST